MIALKKVGFTFYIRKNPSNSIQAFLSLRVNRRWLKVEKEALDNYLCNAYYDCTNAISDLETSGISCPDFKETAPAMVEYYEKHKKDATKHIRIG
ncbi:hypothetical protein [Bacillus alkalicellulosilyticus]|uniref:hypothetical protein n=1 Tax=Alkalihalobacterium alkalicellulosilyticum TaxID=1912214 RepID=UPI001117A5E2|nr:hypothetical protein [Bacillus alkalicellulosilyticus]